MSLKINVIPPLHSRLSLNHTSSSFSVASLVTFNDRRELIMRISLLSHQCSCLFYSLNIYKAWENLMHRRHPKHYLQLNSFKKTFIYFVCLVYGCILCGCAYATEHMWRQRTACSSQFLLRLCILDTELSSSSLVASAEPTCLPQLLIFWL